MSQRLREKLVPLAAWGLIAIAVAMRCWSLGNLPGVNGDEAWYGVQAERLTHGEPYDVRTPTGNIVNPFFIWPQVALHRLFEPSFELLRSVAVASGLAALLVNYWLCRPVFGRRVAAISTVVLAVLPVNIIYSRLAWDASQSLLFCLPVMYWPLRAIGEPWQRVRWGACSLVALAVAILVHPTNIFLAPLLVVALGAAWRAELTAVWKTRGRGVVAVALAALIVFVVGAALAMPDRMQHAVARLVSPADYRAMAANTLAMLSGSGPLEYVAGHTGSATLFEQPLCWLLRDAVGLAVVVIVAIGLGRRWSISERPAEACVAIGLVLGLAAFFILAGPNAISPHFERYGLWLVAPAALLIALSVAAGIGSSMPRPSISPAVALALGGFCLAGVWQHFFVMLDETGGESHLTFRTAATEPKMAAIRCLATIGAESGEQPAVLVREWWNYWPLEYLSYRRDLAVNNQRISFGFETSSQFNCAISFAPDQRGYAAPLAREIIAIRDAAGRELLWLFIFSHQTPKKFPEKLKSAI